MQGGPAPQLSPDEVVALLQAWGDGDLSARDRLLPSIYGELRRRAAHHLRREGRNHTLRPTELVHETYLRLCGQGAAWQNREQLFGVASQMMRRILVDHARRRVAAKRGRGLRVTLAEGLSSAAVQPDMLDLDRALDELAEADERQARLVELRFFGGLRIEEAARALGVSTATANRDWAMARAWLFRRLREAAHRGPG